MPSFALQNVTADAPRGSWTIQVANTSGYAVGDVITIDHVDGPAMDSGEAVINAEYLFFFDGQFFKRQPAYSWNGPGTGAPAFPAVTNFASANAAARTVVPQWRSTSQVTEVVAIAGNTLTIRDPLYIDFPLALRPQVWRTVPINSGAIPVGNRWSGIEHLAVAGGNNDVGLPGWRRGLELHGLRLGEGHRGRWRTDSVGPGSPWQVQEQHRRYRGVIGAWCATRTCISGRPDINPAARPTASSSRARRTR